MQLFYSINIFDILKELKADQSACSLQTIRGPDDRNVAISHIVYVLKIIARYSYFILNQIARHLRTPRGGIT